MRQKQSKKGSRKQEQRSNPVVKYEAELKQELDQELEGRYERYRDVLKDLTLMSDSFMRAVLKNPECTEEVLRTILSKKQLKVISQTLQADYKNLQGRSAILDCVAVDREHNLYNVEIQQKREGASPKRARYHSGLLDMNLLEPGEAYQKLPNSYVIFITETDALGYHLPIYHISRKIQENGRDFPDCAHIIYVDSKNQEDTALGRLMHDFHCKAPEEMYNPVLRRQVYQFKKTREGVTFMCREMDKIYRDGEKIGQKRGIRNEQRRIVNSLKRKGKTMDEIAYLTGIHENVVRKLLGEERYATK